MRNTIVLILLLSLLIALCGCAGGGETDASVQSSASEASENAPSAHPVPSVTEKKPLNPYEGEIPDDIFGVYDEERYTSSAFGVEYLRDGNWSFQPLHEPAEREETLRNAGYVDDMSAQSGQETLGFALAIPSAQFGTAMKEEEYAQAVKNASARDYAGADYDVVSSEVGAIEFGGEQHTCFNLTVAANGMVFYHTQIFIQRGDIIGVVHVSALSEESRSALLNRF